LVGDFTGRGFDQAVLTNTSSRSISISITRLSRNGGAQSIGSQLRVAGDTTESVRSAAPSLANHRGVVMIVTASRPSLIVTLTLPTRPAGMTVVSGLDGR
jgi:hypothetical protein